MLWERDHGGHKVLSIRQDHSIKRGRAGIGCCRSCESQIGSVGESPQTGGRITCMNGKHHIFVAVTTFTVRRTDLRTPRSRAALGVDGWGRGSFRTARCVARCTPSGPHRQTGRETAFVDYGGDGTNKRTLAASIEIERGGRRCSSSPWMTTARPARRGPMGQSGLVARRQPDCVCRPVLRRPGRTSWSETGWRACGTAAGAGPPGRLSLPAQWSGGWSTPSALSRQTSGCSISPEEHSSAHPPQQPQPSGNVRHCA